MEMSNIKRSVSLYSYQDEYYNKQLDLEGCLRETAKTGATGVELLAEQMIRRFPLPIETEEFRNQWFGWMKKYNLEPSCYDAFLENKIYDNRTLKLSEQVNMMKRDIRLASLLGFKNLRTLVSTPLDVIEGSLDYAEEMGVKIGLEVHAPFSLNSGWADGYMEMIHRTGTKYFGFVPDMGIFCKNVPDVVADKARRMGASEECIKIVDEYYAQRMEKGFVKIKYDLNLGKANMEYRLANGMKEMMEAIEKAGGNDADKFYASNSFAYSWSDPQDIIDNIDYIFHTHAKFYNVHEDYKETAVAIPEVVEAFKKAGYTGFLSSEYEGGEHLRSGFPVDSIEQVRRHQEAMRRAIER
jgi:sugar phosphate isomerase/epimerase